MKPTAGVGGNPAPPQRTKTIGIHRLFDHHAQNPYEQILFLTIMIRIPMTKYGF